MNTKYKNFLLQIIKTPINDDCKHAQFDHNIKLNGRQYAIHNST